ncbi:regulator of microtubule dynamics protein 1-like isoform X1 [Stegodyphus dumicola]|uniref:regulator of microtubule dynamics protein 1-like isoform X1 n=1 Tax=Stegodyphus dumicola TaxID=202533 RepID=UPI0015B16570|nr:regulator of microtubule dynamics protein 1-like isoform X1 [Stegodyphus dumicola]
MNRARFLKFCFNVGYRRSIPYKLMNPALKFPKGNKIKIFGCLFSSVFPTLIVVKALSMEKKRGNLIIEADAFYDEAKYEKLYNLLAPHHESDDPEILWRLARAVFEKCRDIKEDKQKLVYLEDALALVDKALEINESCWAAHKWKAILLDYVWRYKSTKNRIVHSFDVRKHMERAIQLNPEDSTSYYLLGEW